MKKKKLTLIANAHIDPVWQWNREEGAGATLSTFRSAADICEEHEGFVFNHNEAMLYEWVERFAPSLFERIRKLVKEGKWHIAGGWYLQPDCNMPSGESIIRQIKRGRNYFREKFGAEPAVAVNYDSFGHSDGLVQILADAGYIGYICFRPSDDIEDRDYVWKGFADSRVLLHRSPEGYNTLLGRVGERLNVYTERMERHDKDLMLWGVGNHGGGPSRRDLAALNEAIAENGKVEIEHGTPEKYFSELIADKLPEAKPNALNYVMQACYTSQMEIKRLHVKLENELYAAERLNACVTAAGGKDNSALLEDAERDLLFSEFHDILPGTCVAEVEERAVAQLHHGLHAVSDVKFALMYEMFTGKQAKKGEFPLFVYNTLPYDAELYIRPEMMLCDQNWSLTERYEPRVYDGETPLAVQTVKEESNIPLDWRKRFVTRVSLRAGEVKRLSCYFAPEPVTGKAPPELAAYENGRIRFEINPDGTVTYAVDGETVVKNGGKITVRESNCDPWGFDFDAHKKTLGEFKLATSEEAARIACDINARSVRITEDGELLRTYEVISVYKGSYAVTRYTVYKDEAYVDVDLRLVNTLADVTVKFGFETALEDPQYRGRTMFGENLLEKGREVVAQQRVTLFDTRRAFTLINDSCYGSHAENSELHVTLLHPAAYTAHPIEDRAILKSDRCYPRFDMGTHNYRFRMFGAGVSETEETNGFITQSFLSEPLLLQYNPTGEKGVEPIAVSINNKAVALSCFKRADDGRGYILRLYNTLPHKTECKLAVGGDTLGIAFDGYMFRTFRWHDGEFSETDCLERSKSNAQENSQRAKNK